MSTKRLWKFWKEKSKFQSKYLYYIHDYSTQSLSFYASKKQIKILIHFVLSPFLKPMPLKPFACYVNKIVIHNFSNIFVFAYNFILVNWYGFVRHISLIVEIGLNFHPKCTVISEFLVYGRVFSRLWNSLPLGDVDFINF